MPQLLLILTILNHIYIYIDFHFVYGWDNDEQNTSDIDHGTRRNVGAVGIDCG